MNLRFLLAIFMAWRFPSVWELGRVVDLASFFFLSKRVYIYTPPLFLWVVGVAEWRLCIALAGGGGGGRVFVFLLKTLV